MPTTTSSFPGLGGGERQWPRGVHGVLGSGAGSAGQCHLCTTLNGLGQITHSCFQTSFYGASVHLDSKLKREISAPEPQVSLFTRP